MFFQGTAVYLSITSSNELSSVGAICCCTWHGQIPMRCDLLIVAVCCATGLNSTQQSPERPLQQRGTEQ
jgi:hypothetical protein